LTQVTKPSRNYGEMHIEQAKRFKEAGKGKFTIEETGNGVLA
jgi:hypothetical protein